MRQRAENVSRGTGELTDLGVTKALVDDIASQIEGSDIEAIRYPATWDDPVYALSVANGTQLVRKAITEYAKTCPDSKMAWFWYSQGAHITTNNFCGMPAIWGLDQTENKTYTKPELGQIIALSYPLSEEVTKNVISIVLFGDPSQRNDTSYNYGSWNNTGNGMFYRADTSACEALGSRIRAYCDAGDPFCDLGKFINGTAHKKYIDNYGEEVAQFVVGKYKNGSSSVNGSSSTTSSSTSTPTNGSVGFHSMSVFPFAGFLLLYLFL
ncbi:hypothetical protein N7532_003992 [Penicillium argentinense]|uniref:Acetylxylan esterase n=1 Tax=Penicillium argentinense TaxID=1131581 RepID=A0A9W9FNI7_9EURO|nr:uncharacterized protein N7532_003992 [Penicillium argentinense]KAJ5103463.1 hypothetical protein N7532_003992 [Penicillium argentinense]